MHVHGIAWVHDRTRVCMNSCVHVRMHACGWACASKQRDDTEPQASLRHPAALAAHKTAAELLAERVSNEVASRQKHEQQGGGNAPQSRAVPPEEIPQPFVLRMGANRITKSESKPRATLKATGTE